MRLDDRPKSPSSPRIGENHAKTPTTANGLYRGDSRPSSPDLRKRMSFSLDPAPVEEEESTTPPGSPVPYTILIPPHSRSSARPTLYVRTNETNGFSFPSTSPPKPGSPPSIFSGSVVSLLGSLGPHSTDDHQLFRRRRSSTHLSGGGEHVTPSVSPAGAQPGPLFHASSNSVDGQLNRAQSLKAEPPKSTPYMLRTPAKAPSNPRDHSLLEYIYNEMMSSRFINTSPISMLMTYLEYHFKGRVTSFFP